MSQKNNEYLLKICGIGSVSELQTAFIRSFAENKFDRNDLPILGVDITTKRIEIEGNLIKLILVNVAGEEEFKENRPAYYRGASALIIFFDKGDRQSFNDILEWKKEFKTMITSPIPMIIVGFQAETEEVTTEEAKHLAGQIDSIFFECTPTLEGEQVNQVFHFLIRKVIEA
ncbi:MAG: Rab family GTPase [Promethearchaeota archaeon]|jgi:Ras-related protein Rab-9A